MSSHSESRTAESNDTSSDALPELIMLGSRPSSARLTSRSSRDVAPGRPAHPNMDNFFPVGVIRKSRSSPSMFDYQNIEGDIQLLVIDGYIHITRHAHKCHADREVLRVYVSRQAAQAQQALRSLRKVMSKIDASRRAWECDYECNDYAEHRVPIEHDSLFYVFNTLQSPEPNPSLVDKHSREAMLDLLEGDVGGCLKTTLYEYQRRSAAYMVQKESRQAYNLDPRLEEVYGPDGSYYYYDQVVGTVLPEKRLYPSVKGGILAETMGYGKTLICISTIVATRGHLPHMMEDPFIECDAESRGNSGARTLLEMAAAANARYCRPWTGVLHLATGRQMFEKYQNAYLSHRDKSASSRYSQRREQEASRLIISSATLVIVPPNLVTHWRQEIAKHVNEGALKILVVNNDAKLPPAKELATYDIVLFSKARFSNEITALNNLSLVRRRWSTIRPDEGAEQFSPLRQIYWLRVIVDEGHNFATQSQSLQIFRLLHVERRWIVSGTPSKGLYGVEVPLGAAETGEESSILESRRTGIIEQEKGNLEQLRAMLTEFLAVQPWSNHGQDSARWSVYMQPTELRYGPILRRTLQSLVVRHQPHDVEITLPPLSNKVVALEPTYYDKLTANLFIFLLTVNVIESEGRGEYMFLEKNKKHLVRLINNLRQAGFWWVGIKYSSVAETLKRAQDYIEEKGSAIAQDDLILLRQAIHYGELALDDTLWKAYTDAEQLGILVEDFPLHARQEWSLAPVHQDVSMLSLSQAVSVKEYVEKHHGSVEAFDGLPGQGLRHRIMTSHHDTPRKPKTKSELLKDTPPKSMHSKRKSGAAAAQEEGAEVHSDFRKTRIVATASAKLTYLLDRVQELEKTEKIIIFYEHQHFGDWIACGLELLNINHLLYGGDQKKRNESLSQFLHSEEIRVMVMDLKQASHGLHVACASRVFIVTPIWNPNVEGQAIKRAHRMSQTKPVFVETLVLKGTLEEKMLQRRKEMQTSSEGMKHAEDLLADRTMNDIIKQERFIELDESANSTKFAPLEHPCPLFKIPPASEHTMSISSSSHSTPRPRLEAMPGPRSAPPASRGRSVRFDIDNRARSAAVQTPATRSPAVQTPAIRSPAVQAPAPRSPAVRTPIGRSSAAQTSAVRSPRPVRPTFTSPAGISYDRPIVLSPSPSPSKRTAKPPPEFALPQARKRRRVAILDTEDPFVESSSSTTERPPPS